MNIWIGKKNLKKAVMVDNTYDLEFKESFKKIAIPVGIQNLFFVSLTFVDALMVGMLGQVEYNAVGLGGQFYFLVNVFVVGFSSSCAIYMAQFFGKEDIKGFRKSAGLGIILCLTLGLIAGGLAIFFPELIISFFTKQPEIIKKGAEYLNIRGFQIPLMSVIIPLATASKTSGNAKLPLKISIVTLSTNTILNYLLIFGNLGFPKLGVSGAAIATLISSLISIILYTIIINITDNYLRGSISDYINITGDFVKKVFKTGWGVIIHEVLWSIGITIFVLILSRMRTDGYTAYNIAIQFIKLAFIFSLAISSAASITIGMLLGRKDIDKALAYEKKYSKIQIKIGFLVSLVIVIATYFLVGLFNISDAIRMDAFYTSVALAIFWPLKSYSGMQAAGILRSGGDTRVPVFFELAGMYFVDIPFLLVLLKFTDLATPIIMFFASTGSLLTSALLYKRVKSRKWAKNLVS